MRDPMPRYGLTGMQQHAIRGCLRSTCAVVRLEYGPESSADYRLHMKAWTRLQQARQCTPGLTVETPKKTPLFSGVIWRPRSELNRRTRICSPLHNHSATRPVTCPAQHTLCAGAGSA